MQYAKRLLLSSLLILCLTALACSNSKTAEGVDSSESIQKSELRILYVGHPGSERKKDFVQFLGKYFAEVNTSNLGRFGQRREKEFDVAIFDYDGDGFKAPRPQLPAGYKKPTVTMGVVGALISSSWGLKTGYS